MLHCHEAALRPLVIRPVFTVAELAFAIFSATAESCYHPNNAYCNPASKATLCLRLNPQASVCVWLSYIRASRRFKRNPYIILVSTMQGGHVGFAEG